MQHQDSCTSLATVNFGGNSANGGGGGASFSGQAGCRASDDVIDDISLSGASVNSAMGPAAVALAAAAGDAVSVADSASSYGAAGQVGRDKGVTGV
jgi:hypothetical protein